MALYSHCPSVSIDGFIVDKHDLFPAKLGRNADLEVRIHWSGSTYHKCDDKQMVVCSEQYNDGDIILEATKNFQIVVYHFLGFTSTSSVTHSFYKHQCIPSPIYDPPNKVTIRTREEIEVKPSDHYCFAPVAKVIRLSTNYTNVVCGDCHGKGHITLLVKSVICANCNGKGTI